jgi:hypothetical protein
VLVPAGSSDPQHCRRGQARDSYRGRAQSLFYHDVDRRDQAGRGDPRR